MRILYDDTAAILEKDIKDAQRLCDVFNDDIAPAYRLHYLYEDAVFYRRSESDRGKVSSLLYADKKYILNIAETQSGAESVSYTRNRTVAR